MMKSKFDNTLSYPLIIALLLCLLGFMFMPKLMNTENVSFKQVIDGSLSGSFEKSMNSSIPILQNLAEGFENLQWRIFGDAKPEVIMGEDGWLFTAEEFVKDEPLAESLFTQNMDDFISILHILEKNNIEVLVALVPDKSRMLMKHLNGIPISQHVRKRYNHIRETLLLSGHYVPDLRIPMMLAGLDKVYMKTDTHWSVEGSRSVANMLAQEVRLQFPHLLNSAKFIHQISDWQHHQGDLSRFVPKAGLPQGYDVHGEPYLRPNIQAVIDENDDDIMGLLDASYDIALVGSSFSADENWAFQDNLQFALQSPIANYAQKGKGFLEPMLELLDQPEFLEYPPQLLIWEIPERYLSRIGGK